MSDGGHRVAGSGHYVEMAKTDQGAGNTARLISSYMNTTDKCLELYYWIRGGTAGDYSAADRARNLTGLSVVVVSEQLDETTVRSVGGSTVDFTRLFARLPSGIHRVVVEGRRDSSNLECAISLDDVAVMNCSRFGMFPILTRKTGGFPCTGILFLHLAATCKSLYTYLFTHHGRKRTTKRTKKQEKDTNYTNRNFRNTLSVQRYLTSNFRLLKLTRLLGNAKLNCGPYVWL